MIPVSTLLTFIGVAAILIAIPGPSVLFVIGRALSLGRGGALLSVVGNSFGALVQSVAIALGLGAIIQASIVVFTIVKLTGAAFLIYLGVQAIRHRKRHVSGKPIARRSWWRSLFEGAVVGVTNPKCAVFFIAVVPQFVAVEAGSIQFQLFELSAVFVIIGVISDSIWALAASGARAWFARSPKRVEHLGAGGGVAMIGLGGVLALTGNKN
ncbi:MAG TPA: LysE family translocator [Galbitalea sp.]|jgi:threonine/homoserine/homoserine lactone efflux protein